ncbi:MAG TPA: hypothetical protein DEP01_03685 [Aminobacterium sp.]|jgi:hypothetical protein|nr:hypothetical protein [Aminobacterium sp.]
MNVYFPNWLTADIMINHIINSFGAHVTRDMEDIGALQFTFIPHEKFYMVPEEDRELFVEIYNIFANWAIEKLAIDLIFQNYCYQEINEANLCSLQYDIERVIQGYNNKNRIEMKQLLAASLGTEPAFILPKELSDMLQDLTGIERNKGQR